MWHESAFTKNMNVDDWLREDKRHVPTVPNQRCGFNWGAEEATVPLRSDCANVLEGRGIKKYPRVVENHFSVTKHKTSPYCSPKERVTAHDDGYEMVLLVRHLCGVTMASLVCGGRRKKKVLSSLISSDWTKGAAKWLFMMQSKNCN